MAKDYMLRVRLDERDLETLDLVRGPRTRSDFLREAIRTAAGAAVATTEEVPLPHGRETEEEVVATVGATGSDPHRHRGRIVEARFHKGQRQERRECEICGGDMGWR